MASAGRDQAAMGGRVWPVTMSSSVRRLGEAVEDLALASCRNDNNWLPVEE
jgi:hypothetical protein